MSGREDRMVKMRTDALRSTNYGPKTKGYIMRTPGWGKGLSPMSRIKIQASNRKRPVSLAKVNLLEDCE